MPLNGSPCARPNAVVASRLAIELTLALLAPWAAGCGDGDVDVPLSIQPVMACPDDVGQIAGVRFDLIGGRDGTPCLESSICQPLLDPPFPTRVGDVMAHLHNGQLFDVPADRRYEIEVIGYSTSDCSYGPDLTLIRFCGQSMPINFSDTGSEAIGVSVSCGMEATGCATSDTTLLFCQ